MRFVYRGPAPRLTHITLRSLKKILPEAVYNRVENLVGDILDPLDGIVSNSNRATVRLDPFDTWSMDNTLSHIIVPMLNQLKATKRGSPYTDDDDVPVHLRSTAAGPKEHDWDTDEHFHARWCWILDEMIWAMEQIRDDSKNPLYAQPTYDEKAVKAHRERVQNGCRLFGKYFQCLWD